MNYLLGIDLGSSSVKVSLVEVDSGRCAASASYPETEAPIKALQPEWAEQRPDDWWHYFKKALSSLNSKLTPSNASHFSTLNSQLTTDSKLSTLNSQLNQRKLVLITGHRRENFGEGFISMVTAMKDLSEKYPEVDFVYPMHLNPNVRKPIHEVFGEDLTVYKNFFFIEPLQYLEFVYLMEKSYLVLTDSGGIQEEAPGLGKPVLVMRNTTERPEALDAGTVKLVGTDHDLIVSEVSRLIEDPSYYDKMSKAVNPYGDGLACSRIVKSFIG